MLMIVNRVAATILLLLVVSGLGGCNAQRTEPVERPLPGPGAEAGPEGSLPLEYDAENQTRAMPQPGAGNPAAENATPENLHAALRARNPGYTGLAQFRIEQGQVLAADLSKSGLSDLTPLASWAAEALDLSGNLVSDLSPLKGMQLGTLYLERTQVKDLSPLTDMPLHELYLGFTPVSDLKPLRGAPLVNLNLISSAVQDINPLADAPLEMLWLSDTKVSDLSPLANSPLVSLTLKGTQVSELAPVRQMTKLQRLHIGATPVTDLTPLRDLQLTRLVFNPANITAGIDAVRQIKTMQQLGTVFEDTTESLMSPSEFWQRYDRGEL